jgi:TatA/E family protein of Tat protein translocase
VLNLGWQEMAAIFVIALVLFGPKKLPELGRTIGKAIAEFRRATSELKATFDREMQQIDRENESIKKTASSYMNDAYGSHDSTYYDPDGYRYGSYDSNTASNPEQVSDPAIQGAESTSPAEHTVTTEPAEGIVARSSSTIEPPHTESSEPALAHASETAAHAPVEHKA